MVIKQWMCWRCWRCCALKRCLLNSMHNGSNRASWWSRFVHVFEGIFNSSDAYEKMLRNVLQYACCWRRKDKPWGQREGARWNGMCNEVEWSGRKGGASDGMFAIDISQIENNNSLVNGISNEIGEWRERNWVTAICGEWTESYSCKFN